MIKDIRNYVPPEQESARDVGIEKAADADESLAASRQQPTD